MIPAASAQQLPMERSIQLTSVSVHSICRHLCSFMKKHPQECQTSRGETNRPCKGMTRAVRPTIFPTCTASSHYYRLHALACGLRARNRAAALARRHPSSVVISIEGGVGWSLAHEPGPEQHWELPLKKGVDARAVLESRPLEVFAWAVVSHGESGAEGVARSASFVLPTEVSALVLQGMELGAGDDQVFNRTRSGQGNGTVGQLTKGLVTRQAYYEQACALALIPFLNPEHYGSGYKLALAKQ